VTSSGDDGSLANTDAGGGRLAARFWLEYVGKTLELGSAPILVGRSSSCHVVLEDGLVSRRHGQFTTGATGVAVEDLGSVNGVYVNGERISGHRTLHDGDRVQIGKQEFLLRSASREDGPPPPEVLLEETLHGPAARAEAERVREELTRRTDALELLCGVADKVLALGRGDEAERLMGAALGNLLKQAQAGVAVAPAACARAAGYAVRVAEATGRARWVDYCFELYAAQARPLPSDVVDQLYVVLRKVSGVAVAGFRVYLETLRSVAPTLSPTGRFVLQRIEGLERLILR
jgi:pSer/pThr/pTyr-binding forkhead associated (FHA) protein